MINTVGKVQIKREYEWISQHPQMVQLYLLIDLFKYLQNKEIM